MEADITWLDSPQVFRVNQLPAHSDHDFYESFEAFQENKSRLFQSLNGKCRGETRRLFSGGF